jgi:hypothetical protein
MSDLMKVGADWGNAGTFKPFTSGISGAQRTQDAHSRYLDGILAGRVFKLAVAAAGPTAYVGASGGTPLLMVHNPANSNKVLSLIGIGVGLRAQGSAAGETALAVWSGPSVVPTGTLTLPTNAYSLVTGGSAAIGVVNTAATSSTALALALPVFTYYWATAAAAFATPGFFDIGGMVVAAPGCEFAIGMTTVPTSLTVDVAMYWEEVPALTQV